MATKWLLLYRCAKYGLVTQVLSVYNKQDLVMLNSLAVSVDFLSIRISMITGNNQSLLLL